MMPQALSCPTKMLAIYGILRWTLAAPSSSLCTFPLMRLLSEPAVVAAADTLEVSCHGIGNTNSNILYVMHCMCLVCAAQVVSCQAKLFSASQHHHWRVMSIFRTAAHLL